MPDSTIRALAALVLVVSQSVPAAARAASDLRATSRVDAVTVYRDRARVTRVARLDLPAGPSRVILSGLPLGLEEDSLRAAGKGGGRVGIFGISATRATGADAIDARAREARARVEALEDEDKALEDRGAAARARLALVDSLRSTWSEDRARNLALRPVAVREWADLAAWADAERSGALKAGRLVERERRALARRLEEARAADAEVRARGGTTTTTLVFELEAERAGPFELSFSYVVSAAGWRPVWDARLDPDAARLELAFYGTLWQATGEDWSDVALSVSTAQPARGLEVPRLDPAFLACARPPRAEEAAGGARPRKLAAPAAPALEARRDRADQVERLAEEPVARVEAGLLAATFVAPRRETLDGAGHPRKIALARFPLAAEVTRTTAPRAEAAAFLTARAVNETGFPLLPGEVGVYVGDEFAGKAALPFTPAGGDLSLAFGRDDRVLVERRVLERRHETQGILSREDLWRYHVRIVLENRHATPVGVKLIDLVPVSRDEQIAVTVLDGSTPPTRDDPDRPGVREHDLTLAPKERKVVELGYRVSFPHGLGVAGLE